MFLPETEEAKEGSIKKKLINFSIDSSSWIPGDLNSINLINISL